MQVIVGPIQDDVPPPAFIDTTKHFLGAFGQWEPEYAANLIVRFCQSRGGWVPFTLLEIEEYCREHTKKGWFRFLGLDGRGFVQQGRDGRYRVTVEFVERCHKASPKTA